MMDDDYMLYVYKVRPCDRKVRTAAAFTRQAPPGGGGGKACHE